MAGGIDLTTLIAQLPHLSKLVTAEHTHPGVQRTLLFQNALQAAQKSRDQVEKIHQAELTPRVKDEQRQRDHSEEQELAQDEPKEENTNSSKASNASPWSGNILDIEV
ncbi:MAG: hypothetical protein ACNI3A_02035 [Desulfovibrio sp.]|uniref:hypothetical protein n=1 Tax=Desulfovibrio sp. 7SRBS1 TaxID=3378064 RepID=UPI003B3F005D